ncbi:hypothetical protein K1719_002355 [Acacia pycnantha]|nr:hypothetical protein K1719_002355 [Acacia pycnantha]
MADNGFKTGFANALQSMMEERLPGCDIKVTPHITSRIKTLKQLWQMAYDMVYVPNTSGFGWDPDTKFVTVEPAVWEKYLKNFRKHRASLRQCGRHGRSKYKTKDADWYDDYEAAAKWKKEINVKAAKKNKRKAKRKQPPVTSKEVLQGSDSDPKPEGGKSQKVKKQRQHEIKKGKRKAVVSDSGDSSWDEEGDREEDSKQGSSKSKAKEEVDGQGDGVRAKLYKQLRRKQKTNVVPKANADFNQRPLEEFDMRLAATVRQKNLVLPYPSVVSLILEKNKIWYLEEGDAVMWTPDFDEEALNRMQIRVAAK